MTVVNDVPAARYDCLNLRIFLVGALLLACLHSLQAQTRENPLAPQEGTRPNVIVIVVDDLRFDEFPSALLQTFCQQQKTTGNSKLLPNPQGCSHQSEVTLPCNVFESCSWCLVSSTWYMVIGAWYLVVGLEPGRCSTQLI